METQFKFFTGRNLCMVIGGVLIATLVTKALDAAVDYIIAK